MFIYFRKRTVFFSQDTHASCLYTIFMSHFLLYFHGFFHYHILHAENTSCVRNKRNLTIFQLYFFFIHLHTIPFDCKSINDTASKKKGASHIKKKPIIMSRIKPIEYPSRIQVKGLVFMYFNLSLIRFRHQIYLI